MLHPIVLRVGEHNMEMFKKIEKIEKVKEIERIKRVRGVEEAIGKIR